jgi:hypothetical protein
MTDRSKKVKALPLLIGPANAEAVCGFNWRWCRDSAASLGVPFVGRGRKRAIRADLFIAALEQAGPVTLSVTRDRERDAPSAQQTIVPADPAAAVRRLLGKKLRAGGQ